MERPSKVLSYVEECIIPVTLMSCSVQHTGLKRKKQEMYFVSFFIVHVCFLVRHGLALRGHGGDASANIDQLLHLSSEYEPHLLQELDKSVNTHPHKVRIK